MTRHPDDRLASALSRRRFLELAVAIGATAAWSDPLALFAAEPWRERRDLFPEGVASGDPDPASILVWTRRPPVDGKAPGPLRVEVASDESFAQVVAKTTVELSADSDWTCRVLVGGLRPATVYWSLTTSRKVSAGAGRVPATPASAAATRARPTASAPRSTTS